MRTLVWFIISFSLFSVGNAESLLVGRKHSIKYNFSFSQNEVISGLNLPVKKKIKIMIIDTEIQVDHKMIKNFISQDKKFKTIKENHGTHVAGIITQRLMESLGREIYKRVEIIPCAFNSLDINGEEITERVQAEFTCLQKAIDQKVDIINFSGGGYFGGHPLDEVERELVKKISDKGILLVAAAGNEGAYTTKFFPCNYTFENVFCVGSVSSKNKKSKNSNYSENLKFMALGEDVLSAYASEDKKNLAFMSGTSMAAPQVSALLAALILGASSQQAKKVVENGKINKVNKSRNTDSLDRSVAHSN